MARLLVRVVDKLAADAGMERMLSKRGDVIEVFPDGWQFTYLEQTNPEWMIVDVPGAPPDAFRMLRERELGDRGRPFVHKRARGLDLDGLPLSRRVFFQGVRSAASVTLNEADVRGLIRAKPGARVR